MSSYNRVIVLGNVTRAIELKYTRSNLAVCDVGLAINERQKNAAGEWVESTVFLDVSLFGRTAEIASEYLQKGSPVLFEGRLKLDSWEDRESGQKRSKLKVVGERMQLLGQKPDGQRERPAGNAKSRREREPGEDDTGIGGAPPDDSDIPF